MNKTQYTIQEILTKWGQSERKFPSNYERLKDDLIRKLSLNKLQPARAQMSSRIPWLSVAFAGLAVLVLLITPAKLTRFTPIAKNDTSSVATDNSIYNLSTPTPETIQKYTPGYYPPPGSEIPTNDSREFLKTDYRATIRTREVQELAQKIQIMVKGFGGRVDSVASSNRWGSISFVVPLNQFETFKTSLKGLVWSKLITEEIDSENLLPQKQSIENQKKEFQTTLEQLKIERGQLVASHRKTIASLQSQINAIEKELGELKIKLDITSDPILRGVFVAREDELKKEKSTLGSRLFEENKKYAEKLSLFDAQIKNAETNLEYTERQDRILLDTVATVRGTISLNSINVLGILLLYFPGHWMALVFGVVAVALYLVRRRKNQIIII